MPSEPSWSKKISGNTVCTWFYALAMLNLFIGLAGILFVISTMFGGKGNMWNLLTICLSTTVVFTNAWSLFLVCNRGLNV